MYMTETEYMCPMQFKMWIKPNAEQSFLYGNHVSRSGLGRVTENMPQYQGVILYSMSDIPLVRNCWLLYIIKERMKTRFDVDMYIIW